jgi:hypothetical protein
MPPSRLDAAGYPRLVNMALVTSGKIPPNRFRPETHKVNIDICNRKQNGKAYSKTVLQAQSWRIGGTYRPDN